MEWSRYTGSLTVDAARFAEIADGNTDARVPTCPDWTVSDLISHLAEVYEHKTLCIQLGRAPSPWPPAPTPVPPLTRMRTALGDLLAEFTGREAESFAYGWYGPDQTVGFWMRRMAVETAVHRADAELAAGVEPSEVPEDIAAEGIGELLRVFPAWHMEAMPDAWKEAVGGASGATVALRAGDRDFAVELTPEFTVSDGASAAAPACTVTGTPSQVLLWLWGRLPLDALTLDGDAAEAESLHRVLGACTSVAFRALPTATV